MFAWSEGMSSSGFLLAVAQLCLRCSIAETPPKWWKGGDWAMESLVATPDPIGVDGEWADIAHTLAWPDYEEDKNKLKTKKKAFAHLTQPDDWIPLGPTDVPYLAVIYRRDKGSSDAYKVRFPDAPNRGASHIEPNTACGGAFMTPNLVLTSCGCVYSLISKMFKTPPIFTKDSPEFPGYNIYDYEEMAQDYLYVSRASAIFTADFTYIISTDQKKYGRQKVNCRDQITAARIIRKNDPRRQSTILNMGMGLLPFTPSIVPDLPDFFPKWPPIPFNKDNDPNYVEIVHIISIGMRQSRAGKFVFYSEVSPSSLVLQHCQCDSYVCNRTAMSTRGNRTTCFKGLDQYTLSGGVIGWPILSRNGTLVGLTASERDPRDGTVLAGLLYNDIIHAIEWFIGKPDLIRQNTPLPPYRYAQVPTKYLVYDYTFDLIQRPKAAGTSNVPPGYLQIFLYTSWIALL